MLFRLILLFVLIASICGAELKEVDKAYLKDTNLLLNPGFESGLTKWLNNTGSSTLVLEQSNPLFGTRSAKWNASAASEYFYSNTYAVTPGLKGAQCSVQIQYLWDSGTTGHITLTVNDGSDDILTPVDLEQTQSVVKKATIHFTCPTSGNIRLKLASTADAAEITFDNAHLGSIIDKYDLSQATFLGAVKWVGTANCEWSTTSATYASFSADSDCTTPTGSNIEGKATAPATKIPAITLPLIKKGRIVVKAIGYFTVEDTASSGVVGDFRFHDGSNPLNGNNIIKQAVSGTSTTHTSTIPVLVGEISYAEAQNNVTIEIQSLTEVAGTNKITATTVDKHDLYISVYYFPYASQEALSVDTSNVFGGVKIAADAAHSFSTTSATYDKATDTDIIAGDKTHFGQAVITSTAGDFGFKMPYLAANVTYLIYSRSYLQNSYLTSDTECTWAVYDGTNEIGEVYNITNTNYPIAEHALTKGTISYDSVQKDIEFTIYAKRVSGGGDCRVRALSSEAEIGIIPINSVSSGLIQFDNLAVNKQYDSVSVTASGWTTTRAVFLPYKTIDGAWRLKGNIVGTMTSASRNTTNLTITGATFKTGAAQSGAGYEQSLTTPVRVIFSGGDSILTINHTVATTTGPYAICFDVELDSKPTWATGDTF